MKTTYSRKFRVTIYRRGEFGLAVQKTEATALDVEIGPYAQHRAAARVRFVPRGKRSPREYVETFQPSTLVLEGWGHPSPDGIFASEERAETGATVAHGRYSACDPRWQQDFDRMIAAYIAESDTRVVADLRRHDTEETR